jgi:hypothetical protein
MPCAHSERHRQKEATMGERSTGSQYDAGKVKGAPRAPQR